MRARFCWIGLSVLILAIAGCGASPSPTANSTATATATATFPSAPTATPVPTANLAQVNPACRPQPHDTDTYYQIGDLVVRQVDFALVYPSKMLPDGTPLKPFLLPSERGITGGPPTDPILKENPGGYLFTVCNGSFTQSHVLTNVSVQIASVTSYTGQLNAWNFCDGYFVRPSGAQYGGCGGGLAADEYLHATFAADAGFGASVVAAQTGTGTPPGGGTTPPLPITLKPGMLISVNVGITAPTSPGQYAFAFAVSVDGADPVYFSTTTPTLLAPIAHKWTGQACLTAAMQQQIPPATNPPAYYICPQS